MLWFECTLIPVISSQFHPAPARECIIFALLSDVYMHGRMQVHVMILRFLLVYKFRVLLPFTSCPLQLNRLGGTRRLVVDLSSYFHYRSNCVRPHFKSSRALQLCPFSMEIYSGAHVTSAVHFYD